MVMVDGVCCFNGLFIKIDECLGGIVYKNRSIYTIISFAYHIY
jgi:hypothetical protein